MSTVLRPEPSSGEYRIPHARPTGTMLCVTHEKGFARQIADRVVFMDQGRIVEAGEPAAFFTCPRSEGARLFLRQRSCT